MTVDNSFLTVTLSPTGGVGIYVSDSPAYQFHTCFYADQTKFLKFVLQPNVYYKSRDGNTYYFDDVTIVDESPYYYVWEKRFHGLCGMPYFGWADTWMRYEVTLMKP